jgi:4-hydroxy-4-methyl-2-oxoglutarate aldolase
MPDSRVRSMDPRTAAEPVITLAMMRECFTAAVVCDALDAEGFRHQSPRVPLRPLTGDSVLIGRCKTTLWADMAHPDPRPYELELKTVDGCQPDDVLIAAAAGSTRSGVWGELLSTAARNTGCVGVIVDGAVRDVARMRQMGFPVFARGTCPYDSKDRQRVIDLDIPVEIDGVRFATGDLVVADDDGVVVVPRAVEAAVVRRAWDKVHAENQVRDAIRAGMKATDAFDRFGVL